MRNFLWATLCLPVACSMAHARNPSAAVSHAMPYALAFDVVEVPYYDRLAVSADGMRIVYTIAQKPPGSGGEPKYDPLSTPASYLGAKLQLAERSKPNAKVVPRTLCGNAGNSWAAAWSHDDSKLAFYADAGGAPSLWIRDAAGCRRLGSLNVGGGMLGETPRWSLDDRTLYVLPPDGKPEATAAIETDGVPANEPKVLVFKAGSEADPTERSKSIPWMRRKFSLAAVDVATGASRTLVPSSLEPSPVSVRLSASGRWLSYLTAAIQVKEGDDHTKSLYVVPANGGEPRKIADGLPELWGPGTSRMNYAWHPSEDRLVYWRDGAVWVVDIAADGPGAARLLVPELGRLESTIYCFTPDGKLLVGTQPVYPRRHERPDLTPRALAVVSLDGAPTVRVPLDENWEFRSLIAVGDQVAWQPEPGTVTAQLRDKRSGKRMVVRFDVATGEHRILWQGYAKLNDDLVPAADQRQLFGLHEDMRTPANISVFDSQFERRQLLTLDSRLDSVQVGAAENFESIVPGYDGKQERVLTTVLLPPGAKRGDRLPAVVMIYPGSDLSNRIEYFGGGDGNSTPNLLYTSRGFAVVLANVTVGPEKNRNDIAMQMVDSLLPQLYRAAELGYVDIERLALSGQSYGGYSTGLIVSQTNLFRAGIPVNGVFDLGGSYGCMDDDGGSINVGWSETGQGRLGAPPWQNVLHYLENSPYYRANRIMTPLLLISGQADQRVPSEESKKLFVALRRMERPARLALYAGQGHVISEWSQASAIDVSERMIAFLTKYLGNAHGAVDVK